MSPSPGVRISRTLSKPRGIRKRVSQGEVESKGGCLSFVQLQAYCKYHSNVPNLCVAWLLASVVPSLELSAFRLGLFNYLRLVLIVR